MLNELKEICKHFHINKLAYCILRLPSSKVSSKEFEVDILIRDTELKNYLNILIAQGFQYFEDSASSHQHFRRGNLHLDLVTALCYGKDKKHFVDLGYSVLKEAIFEDGLYFTKNIDEFTTLLLHCLFDKRDFSSHSVRIFKLIDIIGEEQCVKRLSRIFCSAK